MEKALHVSRRAGLLTSGAAGFSASLLASWAGVPPEAGVDAAATALSSHAHLKFDEWFPSTKFTMLGDQSGRATRPFVDFVLAGYEDAAHEIDQPVIFYLSSRNDFIPERYEHGTAFIGVTLLARHVVLRSYRNDAGLDELSALIAYAITDVAAVDFTVGGDVNLAVITPNKGYEVVPKETVCRILSENERRKERLRALFGSLDGS